MIKRNLWKIRFGIVIVSCCVSVAGTVDFGWIDDFNLKAQADPDGFQVKLSTRFKIGSTEINLVLTNIEKPADAYIIFRLSEIANRPVPFVLEQYKTHKGQGWGVLAKSLGIKPGSREFRVLRQKADIYNDHRMQKKTAHVKSHEKSKGITGKK